jgi:hypothetical protein
LEEVQHARPKTDGGSCGDAHSESFQRIYVNLDYYPAYQGLLRSSYLLFNLHVNFGQHELTPSTLSHNSNHKCIRDNCQCSVYSPRCIHWHHMGRWMSRSQTRTRNLHTGPGSFSDLWTGYCMNKRDNRSVECTVVHLRPRVFPLQSLS